jgi:aminopeptidase
MYEDFAPRLAAVLTQHSAPVKPGDRVLLEGPVEAQPLLVALYEAVLDCGGYPFLRPSFPILEEVFYRKASDDQLDYQDPIQKYIYETIDIRLVALAPTNSKSLSKVDSAKIARKQRAMRPLMELYLGRSGEGTLKWCGTLWPTPAAAQDAEMGMLDYMGFVYRACGLDQPDPVKYWQTVRDQQERLVSWLKGKKHAEVRGPSIELSFDFTDRLWVNSCGEKNMPDGEIFTGPIEDSVNGYVNFNFPTNHLGHDVEGARLVYKNGLVVDVSATKGEDFLIKQLDSDPGARRMGEFAIGTNQGIQTFSRNTLFDEKIGGTIHMAVGMSIPETLGVNKSSVHWDMVHDMKQGGEIWIDGTLFYQNGAFVI